MFNPFFRSIVSVRHVLPRKRERGEEGRGGKVEKRVREEVKEEVEMRKGR